MRRALVALAIVLVACAPRTETVATGLTNPRKIAFEADGTLLVVEAGTGLDDGRIVRVGRDRRATVVLDRDERRSGGLLRLREGGEELLASLRFAARSAPDGDTAISNPYDFLLDPDGTAYVSDASANVIWRVEPDRRVSVHLAWTALQQGRDPDPGRPTEQPPTRLRNLATHGDTPFPRG